MYHQIIFRWFKSIVKLKIQNWFLLNVVTSHRCINRICFDTTHQFPKQRFNLIVKHCLCFRRWVLEKVSCFSFSQTEKSFSHSFIFFLLTLLFSLVLLTIVVLQKKFFWFSFFSFQFRVLCSSCNEKVIDMQQSNKERKCYLISIVEMHVLSLDLVFHNVNVYFCFDLFACWWYVFVFWFVSIYYLLLLFLTCLLYNKLVMTLFSLILAHSYLFEMWFCLSFFIPCLGKFREWIWKKNFNEYFSRFDFELFFFLAFSE